MIKFMSISYEEMIPHGEDYRLILHPDQKYFALKNDDGVNIAVCEVVRRKNDIHINCLHVPDEFQGHGYAKILIDNVCCLYKGVPATAQANDWSIKTFERCGFKIKSQKKYLYWTAYNVRRECDGE